MRKLIIALTLLIAIALVGSAMAVMTGKTVEYAGGAKGKVVFDGAIHAKAGNKCGDCHPKIFGPMGPHKERMKAPMADGKHVAGEFCGTCHDGKKAFAQDEANCSKCHKKAAGGY
ncbi:MAG: hypothetical protein HY805_08505 [Nitrospirae bacterium]|nr:hypothetical protein [Nitrospirota bacterium]